MSDLVTKFMLSLYEQYAEPTTFLTKLFAINSESFHAQESIEWDVERGDRQVSVVVQDLSVGSRNNTANIYTNKSIVPPIHDEEAALNVFELMKRFPGQNPFENNDFQAKATNRAIKMIARLSNKIRRSVEWQASQVLQTGKVDLKDKNGVILYNVDYKPKTEHFPQVTVSWEDPAANVIKDIGDLTRNIKNNGLVKQPVFLMIMGCNAYDNFIKNNDIKGLLDNRRIEVGQIGRLQTDGAGGQLRGEIDLNCYKYQIWAYDGCYDDPQTSVTTPYLDPDKVIILSPEAVLQASYGAIPLFTKPFQAVFPALPNRLSSNNLNTDIFTNAWITPNGKQLNVGAASRPLMVPKSIDRFGCINTVAP